MNMTRYFYATLKYLRHVGSVFITLSMMSLFSVLLSLNVSAQTYEYDDLNRVTKVIYDDHSYTIYEYDANGNIKSQIYYGQEEPKPGTGGSTPGTSGGTEAGDTPGTGQGHQGNIDTSNEKNPTIQHKKGMKAKSNNATYEITSVKNKTASLYKMTNKKKTSYTIANTVIIDGITYKVTKISPKAFRNNKKIKKVSIGKNITNIGKQAFYGCKNLKSITIKSTKLKSVGKQALKGIHKNAKINVPKKQYNKYKKLLKNKGQKNTVKIKKK